MTDLKTLFSWVLKVTHRKRHVKKFSKDFLPGEFVFPYGFLYFFWFRYFLNSFWFVSIFNLAVLCILIL